jgi:Trp operon repressor
MTNCGDVNELTSWDSDLSLVFDESTRYHRDGEMRKVIAIAPVLTGFHRGKTLYRLECGHICCTISSALIDKMRCLLCHDEWKQMPIANQMKQMLESGTTQKAIAANLGVSIATVRSYLSRLERINKYRALSPEERAAAEQQGFISFASKWSSIESEVCKWASTDPVLIHHGQWPRWSSSEGQCHELPQKEPVGLGWFDKLTVVKLSCGHIVAPLDDGNLLDRKKLMQHKYRCGFCSL